jgi:HlyD family secretion protein
MKKRIPILIILLLAGAIAWWFLGRERARGEGGLVLHGNVDIREASLGFRVGGRIAEIAHEEGDAVKAGERLARLDPEPFQRELAEAEAQVDSLQARVDLLQAGYRPEEIAQASAVVREREVTLENAQRIFKRQAELLDTKAISQQDHDDAEARFREAEARLNSAREQLALVQAGYRKEELAQAKADLARAEAAMASSELRLQDATLLAPTNGVVLTRAQEPGAVVPAGATVLTLSLSQPVWVRAYVSEPDLGRVHPGMAMEVVTDSRPGKPYRGQVGYISPRAEFTPRNVETPELRTSLVYRLRIVVDNPDEGLRQGMPVTVRAGKSIDHRP